MANESDELDSKSEPQFEDMYGIWLTVALVCAGVDAGVFVWRIYVTAVPMPGGMEALGTALLGMAIYGGALVLGTLCGVLAGRAGGFRNRSVLTYIGVGAGPVSILVQVLSNPWLL